ncbi:hypothetical protein CLM85_34095 [Streptomyces albidoflavus]|nr:hypothetical protein CLM83_25455 [Streptomyces albidoflavus]PBO20512.1 hypothetical protein CLM85_34095 [Streptomyces albidoflavus]PBO26660.1 hypothetical protein CLM84_30465 [Streptomyces albidoflavus]
MPVGHLRGLRVLGELQHRHARLFEEFGPVGTLDEGAGLPPCGHDAAHTSVPNELGARARPGSSAGAGFERAVDRGGGEPGVVGGKLGQGGFPGVVARVALAGVSTGQLPPSAATTTAPTLKAVAEGGQSKASSQAGDSHSRSVALGS